MGDHAPIVQQAAEWAARKKLPLDADVLEEILRLRSDHDDLPPGVWPAGSVEHLLLERWPGHGSTEPDPDVMGPTLDTFWRYLRGSGQMAFESAPPKRLSLEWRRAVPRMGERYADPVAQGFNRQLFQFAGEELGLDLSSAESIEDLQAMLDQATQAWNELPMEERLRRSPRGSGPVPFGEDRPVADAGPPMPWDEVDEDHLFTRNEPSVTAPAVRRAPFVRRVLALAEWVGDGREVTKTATLRPAQARAAYQELGLVEHSLTVRFLPRSERKAVLAQERDEIEEAVLGSMRSAMDVSELEDLWSACVGTGLVVVRGSRASADAKALPTTDEEWAVLGIQVGVGVVNQLADFNRAPLIHALLGALMPDFEGWDRDDLVERWWSAPGNLFGDLTALPMRKHSDDVMDMALDRLVDLGAFRWDGALTGGAERVVPTPLGHDLALMVVQLLEEGFSSSSSSVGAPATSPVAVDVPAAESSCDVVTPPESLVVWQPARRTAVAARAVRGAVWRVARILPTLVRSRRTGGIYLNHHIPCGKRAAGVVSEAWSPRASSSSAEVSPGPRPSSTCASRATPDR